MDIVRAEMMGFALSSMSKAGKNAPLISLASGLYILIRMVT